MAQLNLSRVDVDLFERWIGEIGWTGTIRFFRAAGHFDGTANINRSRRIGAIILTAAAYWFDWRRRAAILGLQQLAHFGLAGESGQHEIRHEEVVDVARHQNGRVESLQCPADDVRQPQAAGHDKQRDRNEKSGGEKK